MTIMSIDKRVTILIPSETVDLIERFRSIMYESFLLELSQEQLIDMLLDNGSQALRARVAALQRVESPGTLPAPPSAKALPARTKTKRPKRGRKRKTAGAGRREKIAQAATGRRKRGGSRPLLTVECACGCGGTFTTRNPDRKWIQGHNPKRGKVVWDGRESLTPPYDRRTVAEPA